MFSHLSLLNLKMCKDIYRIMAVVKVETNIITSIAVSLIACAVIILIMYVETFKTDVIGHTVFDIAHRSIIFNNRVSEIKHFVYINYK